MERLFCWIRDQVAAYVKGLASKYDTAYKSKTLNTSYGKTVTISKGFYGWKINQGEETSQLYDIIRPGKAGPGSRYIARKPTAMEQMITAILMWRSI